MGTVAAGPQAPASTAPGSDVDQIVSLIRKDVRAEKADILAKTLKLDSAQAAKFWPIYKAYETERAALGDQRLAVILDLAQHFDTLDDAKARVLLDRSFAIDEKRIALEKKYRDEFLKVLPTKVAARFFQVDYRLNSLIALKVSSAIPLVE
jgi:hypothetical protein